MAKRRHLARAEVAPRAGGKISQRDRPERDPRQLLDRMADGGAHPPDEVLASFVDGDLEPRLGREPLYDADARGRCLAVLEPDAAPQPDDRFVGRRPAHLRDVDTRDGMAGMEECRRQRPVVRQEQHPRRIEIEPADREEALARLGDQPRDRRPPFGILERAHHAARLVERDRPPTPWRRDALPVDGDDVGAKIGADAELAHHDAVHRDATRRDERLGVAPGGDARPTEQLLQALGGQAYSAGGSGSEDAAVSSPGGASASAPFAAASTCAMSPSSRSGGNAERSGRPKTSRKSRVVP